LVSDGDRTALLRRGIVVLDAEAAAGRLRVAVTGAGLARVHEVVARELGDDVDVDVLGETPRHVEPREIVGQMEREEGRLQVRVVLCGDEHVDEIVVAEDESCVVVMATVCTAADGETGDSCEVPHHVYLTRPLGGRPVIDGSTGDPVPYKNVWAEIEAREDLGLE
jgi:hypothetical protein